MLSEIVPWDGRGAHATRKGNPTLWLEKSGSLNLKSSLISMIDLPVHVRSIEISPEYIVRIAIKP